VLYQQGEAVQSLYFPISGVVARFLANAEAQSIEFSVCGSEGAIGTMAILGAPAMGCAMALCDSTYLRCSASKAIELMDAREFRTAILKYTRYMMSEIIQNALCNTHHTTEQRFCRWLLMYLDRAHRLQLDITHDMVSRLLGVRREGVSEVAGRLRAHGAIEMHRRHIVVLDRTALLRRTCDCYTALQQKYQRLLPEPQVAVGDERR
jgi:CRP-like cAMP-binding protein